MYLALSIVFFAVFVTNVLMGSMNNQAFLSDVQEMLLMAAAAVAFVIAILKAEKKANQSGDESSSSDSL